MKQGLKKSIVDLKRAAESSSMKFERICEPNLIVGILKLITKEQSTSTLNVEGLNELAKNAQGKKSSSSEYTIFREKCSSKLVLALCNLALSNELKA